MIASSKILHVVGASDVFVTELLDTAAALDMDVRVLPVKPIEATKLKLEGYRISQLGDVTPECFVFTGLEMHMRVTGQPFTDTIFVPMRQLLQWQK